MASKRPIGPNNPSNDFEVRGHITRPSKAAVTGAAVHIYDQNLRKRQKLAQTTKTDAQGAYSAVYHSKQFSQVEQGSADLVVVVTDADDVVLATSPIRVNAKPLETIDLVLWLLACNNACRALRLSSFARRQSPRSGGIIATGGRQ